MKVCTKCGLSKNDDCFHRARRQCKICRNAATRLWYVANLEKARANMAKWRAKNPEKDLARHRDWRSRNPEKCRAIRARWRLAHPEKIKAIRNAWRLAHPEKIQAKKRAWRLAHPEKARARNVINRVRLINSVIVGRIREQWPELRGEHIPTAIIELRREATKAKRLVRLVNQLTIGE